jgi:CDP-diacylglycerol--serine O-phosphatidyltransferase
VTLVTSSSVHPKHLVPNLVTLANIVFGLLSILAAADGRYERACVLLFLAGVCDMCDGKLARLLDASSRFGMELDSLSDAISFGVAPALLVYFAVLRGLGIMGVGVAALYVLCGVLRLARFNVETRAISKVSFLGMPIPGAAGYILSFVIVRHSLPIWVVALGTLLAALAMVSTIKVPKFTKGGVPSLMLYVGLALFVLLLVWPSALTWHAWNGWNLVLLATNYFLLHRRGYLAKSDTAQTHA